MNHDDRCYRVFIRFFGGDVDERTIKFSCGNHLADVVDLVRGDSCLQAEVESWTRKDCEIKEGS